MKTFILDKIQSIEKLPASFTKAEIGGDLKSFGPGEWGVFKIKSGKRYIGFANSFSENNVKLRLIEKFEELNPESIDEVEYVSRIIHRKLDESKILRDSLNKFIGPNFRFFYGDQDGLPGLIIDYYENAFCVQINTAGIDRYRSVVIEYLKKVKSHPVILMDNSNLRKMENLPVYKNENDSELKALQILDNDLILEIPIENIQKAGFYFDHSPNRKRLAEVLQKMNKRKFDTTLDLFSYIGAWGLLLLKHGNTKHVTFVDQGDFKRIISKNSKLNSIDETKFEYLREDVLKFFTKNKQKFDIIICDPPALSKSFEKRQSALEGYKKFFTGCLEIIKEGGVLVAASCTHGISFEELTKIISKEATKLNRKLVILDMATQGIDHPISSLTETAFYLKYICYYVV